MQDTGEARTGAPTRYPVQWQHERFASLEDLEEEMRRAFDICHGCRRCFNLCNSFPKLFSLVDESETGELDSVPSSRFGEVVDDCTLCDMCFMTKCPYTPPHAWNLDFPHLMLRYRALADPERNLRRVQPAPRSALPHSKRQKKDAASHSESETASADHRDDPWLQPEQAKVEAVREGVSRELTPRAPSSLHRLLSDIDRIGPILSRTAPISNALSRTNPLGAVSGKSPAASGKSPVARRALERIAQIDARAALPRFASRTLLDRVATPKSTPRAEAPHHGQKKVCLYASCLVNYSHTSIGLATKYVLEQSGAHVEVVYPECCGMPQLEHGDIANVCGRAERIAELLGGYVERGYDVVTPTASCALMLKFEWPLLAPHSATVRRLSENAYDASEYALGLLKTDPETQQRIQPLKGTVTLHHACHARAQNMGFKSRELLSLIPELEVEVTERCSGHGGSWGTKVDNFDLALKVGRPPIRQALLDLEEVSEKDSEEYVHFIASDCPLAATHIGQGVEAGKKTTRESLQRHPIEILAAALQYREDKYGE